MTRFNTFNTGAPKSSSDSSTRHRWENPQGPAANKTAFDCIGSKKAKNAPSAHAGASKSRFSGKSSFTSASTGAASARTTSETHFRDAAFTGQGFTSQKNKTFSPVSACAKILGGACMALVGLPLLILPGPGLLFIGGGAALVFSGISDLKRAFA